MDLMDRMTNASDAFWMSEFFDMSYAWGIITLEISVAVIMQDSGSFLVYRTYPLASRKRYRFSASQFSTACTTHLDLNILFGFPAKKLRLFLEKLMYLPLD